MSCKNTWFPKCCNPALGCCFRGRGLAHTNECTILWITDFRSGLCPFRKLSPEGPNEYDLARASPVDAAPDSSHSESNSIWRETHDDY